MPRTVTSRPAARKPLPPEAVSDVRPQTAGADAPRGPAAEPAALAAELVGELGRFGRTADDNPFANPIQQLSLELSRRLESGALDHAALDRLVQHLTTEGFARRATRLAHYVGETDPAANDRRIEAIIRRLAVPEDGAGPVPFERFQTAVAREAFGIVMTAHPTFSLSSVLMADLAALATGFTAAGAPLSAAERAAALRRAAAAEHRPDGDLSLEREHTLSLTVIANVQAALRRLYAVIYRVAAEVYPTRWTELTPCLLTVASWVGYDLDGRSDIHWTDTLHKRLRVQVAQLRHYQAEVRAIRAAVPRHEDLLHILELIESRLALAINETTEELAVFGAGNDRDGLAAQRIQKIARRMHEGRELRLTDSAQAIELIDRAIVLAGGTEGGEPVHRLTVLRAELANYGLGMARTHVRINATQVHNAIRKAVGLHTAPNDPRYRQSYLTALNDLLARVKPVTINFGSLIAERTSAKRLFMVVAQMLKYADSTTPVRFLIAECESAFTALTALYYAKLFGVDDRVDISPLFETEKALELGSRVIDQLLDNPHYRAYVQARGRLCIQTGFSDAGRYLGQTPASASIERLRLRIARLFAKHRLDGVQLLIFDTHGESIGRGAHPAGFPERLAYMAPPAALRQLADLGIDFKQEVSFQGGDGFLYFMTEAGAYAVLTRILEHLFADHAPPESDPFYDDPDYITEFFTTVKEFQVSLMGDGDYGALLGAFGTNLLFPSGSRAIKREHESAEEVDQTRASQFRAIPHNAILLQMGLPANVVAGVGAAIDKDPERFQSLYRRSPRLRSLIGMVEYGVAVANADALRAYVDTMDPTLWLLRAARCPDAGRAEAMRALAGHLQDMNQHARLIRMFRTLYGDLALLHAGLATTGPGTGALIDESDRTALALLHAIRLTLMHELFLLATRIPEFSSQHATTHSRVIGRILHLDVPTAVAQLEAIFPATGETGAGGDYGEPATYVSDESQNYRQENERIFKPMTDLHGVIRRVGTAVSHRIGFFG